MTIEKGLLGLAGEYAVAAELCRRGQYTQLTLGNQKRTDLLIYQDGYYTKVEVKCKQGSYWPNCRGIGKVDPFIVFVDFEDKENTERPGFYVMTTKEWSTLVRKKKRQYLRKHPGRRVKIDDGCMVLLDEIKPKLNRPYRGCSVLVEDVKQYRDQWEKISDGQS